MIRAEDLTRAYPVLDAQAPASDGADLLAAEDVEAVFVVQDDRLAGIVTDIGLLRFLLPGYLSEDETLARVLEEGVGASLWRGLNGKRIADLLGGDPHDVPEVEADDTLIEVAVRMSRTGSFLVAVWRDGRLIGGITSSALLTALRGERR